MNTTIHAYTEPGSNLPAYINVREDGETSYAVTVRTRGSESPATIYLDRVDLEELAADIFNHFCPVTIAEAMTDDAKPKTAAEMAWDAKHDPSCVGAFARARP